MVVIVKCKECDQEYELDESDNLSNFQCECGGALEETKNSFNLKDTSNRRSKTEDNVDVYLFPCPTCGAIM